MKNTIRSRSIKDRDEGIEDLIVSLAVFDGDFVLHASSLWVVRRFTVLL